MLQLYINLSSFQLGVSYHGDHEGHWPQKLSTRVCSCMEDSSKKEDSREALLGAQLFSVLLWACRIDVEADLGAWTICGVPETEWWALLLFSVLQDKETE